MMVTDHFLRYLLLCSLLICGTRGDAIGNGGTGGGSGTCCLVDFVEKELCLTLYIHQTVDGPNKNEAFLVAPPTPVPNGFGTTYMDDWEIVDGLGQNAKVVARAQGVHFVSGWYKKEQWSTYHSIVFEDDSGWNGSSLEVRGPWNAPYPYEWAIVGGIGDFTFARGIVSGRVVSGTKYTSTMEIYIQALYRPMKKPFLAYK